MRFIKMQVLKSALLSVAARAALPARCSQAAASLGGGGGGAEPAARGGGGGCPDLAALFSVFITERPCERSALQQSSMEEG